MNPQFYDYVFDQLYAAGALEVYTMPVIMKKSRPGNVLTVLVPVALRQKIIDMILRETSTIGVRWQEMQRAKAQREIQAVRTILAQIRVKKSHAWAPK